MLRPAPESQTQISNVQNMHETFGFCHHQNAKHGVLTIVPTTHESWPLFASLGSGSVVGCQSIALSQVSHGITPADQICTANLQTLVL